MGVKYHNVYFIQNINKYTTDGFVRYSIFKNFILIKLKILNF